MTANSDHATTILGARIPQIDQALGLVGTEPPFKDVLDNARHAMARMLTMNDQATALEAVDSSDVIEEAARLFAAGELDIDGVSDLAARIAAPSRQQALDIIGLAQTTIGSEALVELNRVGDAWLLYLRPAVDKALASLSGNWRDLPRTPIPDDNLPLGVRHNLGLVVARWDEVHDLAVGLVSPGTYAPAGSDQVRRWLYPAAYTGGGAEHPGNRLSTVAAYFMSGATPGLWTAEEVRVANPPPPPPVVAPVTATPRRKQAA